MATDVLNRKSYPRLRQRSLSEEAVQQPSHLLQRRLATYGRERAWVLGHERPPDVRQHPGTPTQHLPRGCCYATSHHSPARCRRRGLCPVKFTAAGRPRKHGPSFAGQSLLSPSVYLHLLLPSQLLLLPLVPHLFLFACIYIYMYMHECRPLTMYVYDARCHRFRTASACLLPHATDHPPRAPVPPQTGCVPHDPW